MDNIKLLLAFWDTRQQFNIDDDLADHIMAITQRFGRTLEIHSSRKDMQYAGEVVINSLNELMEIELDYTHVLVIASGCIILDPDRCCRGLKLQINDNPGMCLSGHILHTGLWDSERNPQFATLHEQTMLISKSAIHSMMVDGLVINDGPGYTTDEWQPFNRSATNVHDDYTPHSIWTDRESATISLTKKSNMGVAEELLNYCLTKGWHIQNFNNEMRGSKKYSYHIERPKEFNTLLNMDPRVIPDDAVQGHKEFFAKSDYSNKVWVYNTERFSDSLAPHKYNAFVGVAAGFLPWQYIASYDFTDDAEVVLVDVDDNALMFQKWFLDNYVPADNLEWDEIVDAFATQHNDANLLLTGNKSWSIELWRIAKVDIDKKWSVIKNYTVRFINDDIILGDMVTKILKEHSHPMVWFSNVFRYIGQIEKTYDSVFLQKYLNQLLAANRNVQWIGDNINVGTTTGPNSNPVAHELIYKRIRVPTMPTEDILGEIAKLEAANMFTDHRGGSHPGWSSFVLHGLGYDKTLGYEYYGHDSDAAAPYTWTDEAMELTPTLVNYFKKAAFRKNYHRVRIMRLAPGGYISIHDDDPQKQRTQWAMNMAINNPIGCEMHFWNHDCRYLGKVPWTDGDCFSIRIHYPHMVMNNSDTIRYHIIVHGND